MTIPNRDELENDLAARLAKAQVRNKRLLLDALGTAVEIAAITAALWDEIAANYRAALQPALESAYVASASASMESGVGIAWDVFNERAARWASDYTYELVRGITDNDKRFLQAAVESFYRDKLTLGDLTDKITRQYSPLRAELIAITETTRASVEGDRAYVNELRNMGAKLRGIVETNLDERVCIVCGGKQGMNITEAGYPPFHPRCRCNVRYVNEVG